MIAGLILSAGLSSRMGRSKALLPHPVTGEPFVRHLIGSYRRGGIDYTLVVGRAGDAALRSALAGTGAQFVANPHPDRGQLSSLVVGLQALPDAASAAMVTLVDIPLVLPETIGHLVAASKKTAALIIRPTFQTRHGHPVVFKRAVFDELCHADPLKGAREIVRADPSRVLDLAVSDAGVLIDIDTPEDYTRLGSG